MQKLFQALVLGDLHLKNRIVMAPMTRNRADAAGVPGTLMAEYYGQRGDAGLIVAEGTWPSAAGQAYCRQPGISTPEQIKGWSKVTEAVHARGGLIVLQIMHGGRIGSHHIKAQGTETLAPSALQATGEVMTDSAGMQAYDVPRALETQEVKVIVEEHAQAARNARLAGFDGVELHCTSGYLPMQFLCSGTNLRTDEYGGTAANRSRFAIECLREMGLAIGPGRVGLRVNPGNTYNDTSDENSVQTHIELMKQAAELQLAYLHVMRAPLPEIDAFELARTHFGERLILNDGFNAENSEATLLNFENSALSFARHFIGNPDLVQRLQHGYALVRFDRKTLYTPGAAGYTSYVPYTP